MDPTSVLLIITILEFLHLQGIDARDNVLCLKMSNNNNTLEGSFTRMHEDRVVPLEETLPIPHWMHTRPREISTLKCFIHDPSEQYFEGRINTEDRALHHISRRDTPAYAEIIFMLQVWDTSRFERYKRSHLIDNRIMKRKVPPPKKSTIYIMTLNGDIYAAPLKFKSPEPTDEPVLARPVVTGPLRDAFFVHSHLVGGEAVGMPVQHRTVQGQVIRKPQRP